MAFADALDRAPVSLMHDENTPPNTNASSNKDTFSNTETPLLSQSPQTNIPASEPKDLPQGFERNLPPSWAENYSRPQYLLQSTLCTTHSQMLGKFEYTRGPIFKVVLEC